MPMPEIIISDNEISFSQVAVDNLKVGAEDCCEAAKNAWEDTIEDYMAQNDESIKIYMLRELLSVESIPCKDFLKLLLELKNVTSGNTDIINTVMNIFNKYVQVNVKQSIFTAAASAVKQAGAEALELWMRCTEIKEKNPDWNDNVQLSWKGVLLRDEYKYQTWDNTLKALKCPECGGQMKQEEYRPKKGAKDAQGRFKCEDCGHVEVFI